MAHSTVKSSPFFQLHLILGNAKLVLDQPFGSLHQPCGTAGIEDRVAQISYLLLDPVGIDAPASPLPGIVIRKARAGDLEIKVRILLFQLAKLLGEDDVVRVSHAIEHGDFRFQAAPGCLPHEASIRRHA